MRWHIWIDAGLPAPSLRKGISDELPKHDRELIAWKAVSELGEGVNDVDWMTIAETQAIKEKAKVMIITQDNKILKVPGESQALGEKTDAGIFLAGDGENQDVLKADLIKIIAKQVRAVIVSKNKFERYKSIELTPPFKKRKLEIKK